MAQFTVNTQRFDPYKNFKFRVKWNNRFVAGVSKASALTRTTEVVTHREGGDPQVGLEVPGERGGVHGRLRGREEPTSWRGG